MSKLSTSAVLMVTAMVSLSSCMVGPNYQRPDTAAQLPANFKVPAGWKVAEPADAKSKGAWWKTFNDSRLNGLMANAMADNQSLKAAFLRVEQARTIARTGRASLLPDLSFDPTTERRRRSGTTRSNINGTAGATTSNVALPLVLDYEIDLWGKLRRQLEAVEAEAATSEADYENVMLALQADLAISYFNLAAADRELAILREGLALRKKSLDLNQQRFDAGDVDEVDVSRAITEVAATESDIIGVQKMRAEFENAIAVLIGKPSSDFSIPTVSHSSAPPTVSGTLPSALLERRPDIAAAERKMQAANARIGAAQAAFFPSVRLNGDIGFESSKLSKLFTGDSLAWGLGPSVSYPVFDGRRNQGELDRSRLLYEETVATYRQTILNAVREVDNALSGVTLLAQQYDAQERTVTAANRTVELSQQRYDAGIVAYFDVVEAQRTALEAERARSAIKNSQHLASIALFKALGGAW
ncbi:MAG: efflux transporter outer membrane subunit [Verrucomicrobiae bacterium]|nr:efflux transporter outer membrane subunit [Verrucomicrobiae bacterium]